MAPASICAAYYALCFCITQKSMLLSVCTDCISVKASDRLWLIVLQPRQLSLAVFFDGLVNLRKRMPGRAKL